VAKGSDVERGKVEAAEAMSPAAKTPSHERQAAANPSAEATVWYEESRDRLLQGMRSMAMVKASSARSSQCLGGYTDLVVTSWGYCIEIVSLESFCLTAEQLPPHLYPASHVRRDYMKTLGGSCARSLYPPPTLA
jgi:hypothetical protein